MFQGILNLVFKGYFNNVVEPLTELEGTRRGIKQRVRENQSSIEHCIRETTSVSSTGATRSLNAVLEESVRHVVEAQHKVRISKDLLSCHIIRGGRTI